MHGNLTEKNDNLPPPRATDWGFDCWFGEFTFFISSSITVFVESEFLLSSFSRLFGQLLFRLQFTLRFSDFQTISNKFCLNFFFLFVYFYDCSSVSQIFFHIGKKYSKIIFLYLFCGLVNIWLNIWTHKCYFS